MRLGPLVTVSGCLGDGDVEDPFRVGKPPCLGQRQPELRHQFTNRGVVLGQERGRAAEKVGRRRQIVASKCGAPRGSQMAATAGGQRPVPLLCGRLDLHAAVKGLLEVVAGELGLLSKYRFGAAFEPPCVTLVEIGAGMLGKQVVGGVADQDVVEAVSLLALQIWPSTADQLAAEERPE